MGGDIIPPVDNINTFEVALDAETDLHLLVDSTVTWQGDRVALGHMNDPVFGQTFGDVYFNLSSPFYGTYPFINKDSVTIDSVVLSIAYTGAYGDTNSTQTVSVWEISQGSGFADTGIYYYNALRQQPIATTGSVLGTKTFTINKLNDSIQHIRNGDTTSLVNVLRIPLDNSLGTRFAGFDTSSSAVGGFHNDSIFQSLFRGVKVQAESSTGFGGLSYFSLTHSETKLVVYFRAVKNGDTTVSSFSFRHSRFAQANIIRRQNNGDYAAALNNPAVNEERLFIQSVPGSYASIFIPQLSGFENKVIHRAELLAYKIPSSNPASDEIFTPPSRLFLDRDNSFTPDTVFNFDSDLPILLDGFSGRIFDFRNFGGTLQPDNTYRFNITRYVQRLVTRGGTNDTLRLYAPLRPVVYSHMAGGLIGQAFVNAQIADGRVVLAGGNHPDPALRLRLRIIYTNL